MPSQIVLSISGLSVWHGPRIAVSGLSLEVWGGEVYGLLGPNGSGKSSTLSAIAGTLCPRAGSIQVCGRTITEAPSDYRHSIGLVPQELALYEEFTCLENLLFFGRLYGLKGESLQKACWEAMEFVRLTEQARQTVHTLSGGMQRRLNLACALLHRPALLLLDEPTVGVDLAARDAILASLVELRARGTAVLYCTHHLAEAEQLCDRVGLMNRGRLVDERCLASPSAADLPARGQSLDRLFRQLTGGSVSPHEVPASPGLGTGPQGLETVPR